MNCFILLLLLGCCGWGNGCGNNRTCNDSGCGMKPVCCRRERMGNSGAGCCDGRNQDRRDDCMRNSCGCQEERRAQEGCCCDEGHHHEHHDQDDCGCENPGMIPPPWQDYPKFPRRDNGDGCSECGA